MNVGSKLIHYCMNEASSITHDNHRFSIFQVKIISFSALSLKMRNINLRLGEMHLLRNTNRMGETTTCSPSVPQNNFGSG